MSARYWVLVAEPVLEQIQVGELLMPGGLRLIRPDDDTSSKHPGSRWCYFEDDGAPATLNGKRVELTFVRSGNTVMIGSRSPHV